MGSFCAHQQCSLMSDLQPARARSAIASNLISRALDRQPQWGSTGRPVPPSNLIKIKGWKLSSAGQKQARSPPLASADGGGGGSIPINPRLTGGNDDEDASHKDTENILTEAGMSASELPADMQAALSRGALSAEILLRWIRLAALPVIGSLAKVSPAFRDRVLGNPRFLLVLFIELAMGCSAKLTAEARQRGDAFKKEMNFVLSDLALEIVGDISIVWLLSPKVSFSVAPASALARWSAALPGFASQRGGFPLAQRAQTFLYRGVQFFGIGFFASVVGHGLTKYLLERQEAASGEKSEKPLAPVLDNSLAWGGFMAASSNTRYQIVATLEERLLDPFVHNPLLKTVLTFALRFGNTFVGSENWVQYASMIGIQ